MIGQMKVLLRVKELKQDQAFRSMQAKRQQVETAKRATEEAKTVVDESARTLRRREDAIYDTILGQIVDLGALDDTRGRVVQLEKDHTGLKDLLERAAHVQNRLEGELVTTTTVYRAAVKVRDKYIVITDDMQEKATAEAEYREEMEVEDLFSKPIARPA